MDKPLSVRPLSATCADGSQDADEPLSVRLLKAAPTRRDLERACKLVHDHMRACLKDEKSNVKDFEFRGVTLWNLVADVFIVYFLCSDAAIQHFHLDATLDDLCAGFEKTCAFRASLIVRGLTDNGRLAFVWRPAALEKISIKRPDFAPLVTRTTTKKISSPIQDEERPDAVEEKLLREALVRSFGVLNDKERVVIANEFAEPPLTQLELAEKIGVGTQGRVSQIKSEAIRKLRRRLLP